MSRYRIYQDSNGYHVQEDKGKWHISKSLPWYYGVVPLPPIYKETWVNISSHSTLKAAKKAKEKLEIAAGRVIE